MIEPENLSYTELAKFLEAELAGEFTPGPDSSAEQWAAKSQDVRPSVYEFRPDSHGSNAAPKLGYAYAHDHIGLVKQRLYQGGLRLAALFNSIFR